MTLSHSKSRRGQVNKPKVGDQLTLVNCGNLVSGGGKPNPRDCTVVKVGRKYFFIAEEGNEEREHCWKKFHIEGRIQVKEYCINYTLYNNLQEYLDEKEKWRWQDIMRETFGTWGRRDITLEQYRKIAEILNIKIEED